ncbi:DNA polymerase/3'-5' exonuclease PolX [Algivirga pacifica]|uniref:Helix-hairpin-helix domain-containing protein n=1 Tax=Algivirga pacifica TaxID=1162670 RepID=A0ABP9DCH9_9BACT
MSNKEIAAILKTAASLMEIHGANPFKVKAYASAVFNVEKAEQPLEGASKEELQKLGFSKSVAEKIAQINEEGTFEELKALTEETPAGVMDILQIKGIGGKKIGMLWKELGIESLQALEEACRANKIQALKGFGAKTEQAILDQIQFLKKNESKLHFSDAKNISDTLVQHLEEKGFNISPTGQVRRQLEVIDKMEWVLGYSDLPKVKEVLKDIPDFDYDEKASGPLNWRGVLTEQQLPIEFYLCKDDAFAQTLLLTSSAGMHLTLSNKDGKTLSEFSRKTVLATEEEYYKAMELPYFEAPLREGLFESEWIEKGVPQLVQMEDLKGILHNHTTYSDGKHTLREMAEHCKALGYQYLGITDHSKSAFYANGLSEERILEQHQEIDALNQEMKDFTIFKGIESDILNDGQLDYSDEVLASFDFVIASVHSNLKMDQKKATERILKAVINPYTTMLGHPTGRLLLKREGYPIDHKAIIDACATHNVIIEINANPWRLDLDWRWVKYALDQGVKISINPDAHKMEGYDDMQYGLYVGQKAGLTKEMTFNAMNAIEVNTFFEDRKKNIK